MAELWWLLRDAVLHYIRAVHPNAGEHKYNDNTRQAAKNKVREYANLLQRYVSLDPLIPSNLMQF